MPKNKGTRGSGDANIGRGTGGAEKEPPVDKTPTLDDLGISKKESAAWQKLADLEDDKVRDWR